MRNNLQAASLNTNQPNEYKKNVIEHKWIPMHMNECKLMNMNMNECKWNDWIRIVGYEKEVKGMEHH